DRGHLYTSMGGGMSGGFVQGPASGPLALVGAMLYGIALRPGPPFGFETLAAPPVTTRYVVLTLSYGNLTRRMRVPLHLGALRKLVVSTPLRRVLRAPGFIVRLKRLRHTVGTLALDYAIDGTGVTDGAFIPSTQPSLTDQDGHTIWPNSDSGGCSTS